MHSLGVSNCSNCSSCSFNHDEVYQWLDHSKEFTLFLLRLYLNFFNWKVLVFILYTKHSSLLSPPPSAPYTSPTQAPIHSSEKVGTPRAYQIEAGPSPSPHITAEQGIGNVHQKASSCTGDKSWSPTSEEGKLRNILRSVNLFLIYQTTTSWVFPVLHWVFSHYSRVFCC